MKFVALLSVCIMAVNSASVPISPAVVPAPVSTTPIPILINDRVPIDNLGGYGFRIQTGNGIQWAEQAAPAGPLNQVSRTGQYRFLHPDGTMHLLTYTAGINGFQPISDMLPTPHPLEPWHIEQIEFAKRQKAEAAAKAAAAAAQGTAAV